MSQQNNESNNNVSNNSAIKFHLSNMSFQFIMHEKASFKKKEGDVEIEQPKDESKETAKENEVLQPIRI